MRRRLLPCALALTFALAAPAALRAGEVILDVFVDVPAVIAVDVTGDLVFDLSRLPGPGTQRLRERLPARLGLRVGLVRSDWRPGDQRRGVRQQRVRLGRALRARRGGLDALLRKPRAHVRSSRQRGGFAISRAEGALWPPAKKWLGARPGAAGCATAGSLKLVTRAATLVQTPREGMQTTVTYALSRTE